ncbi:hypothetical protein [Pseudoxanthomonas spadix]|jgi:hypothetical protein|uniref:Uncharacterized protein n=1 Tax=Pseudoxanthomonas spadix (strain BD-a59) TaxID=1045855 RepID=G7UWD4_PSEUP|nr:hypothetical protein [Pseudoxanthomonas spadix]AER55247.1 hypothetical protein DSC_02970 [Pseudoxanthomonas spadix BD-a59]MBP3974013.1 hypothetical protein [Pseudoxanthomonas spadix]
MNRTWIGRRASACAAAIGADRASAGVIQQKQRLEPLVVRTWQPETGT